MDIKPHCICQFLVLKMESILSLTLLPHIHIWICIGLSGASQGSCCPGNNAYGQMPVLCNLGERTAFEVIYIKIKFVPVPTE